jgi:hypothetical protein
MSDQTDTDWAADGNLDVVVGTLNNEFLQANLGIAIPVPGAGGGRVEGVGIVPESAALALCLGAVKIVLLRPKRRLSRTVKTA